ncbi:response regulator [filamentous cyanobacterium LEGE 11480]|uniref:Response regulator n=1 Tax=Romeriopsis navalis LEGE 11480 TaxID=2777977 RepID=A0A928VSN5_9CYAN|nr:response regulator [Romeriopsis navalis]MBE9031374.1 response regulator [Romeriopsis navalis LEGE 11480]
MNILLVEDDALLAKGTARIIERQGQHQVQVSMDPEYIFEVCSSGAIDLIIMDVNLPGAIWQGEEVTGSDLSKYLKSQPLTQKIPIIVLTAYAMRSEQNHLLQVAQADALFTKPLVDYGDLLKTIADLTVTHPPETNR